MKNLLLLFCLLPIIGFSQSDSIRIDSVSLVSYEGFYQKKVVAYRSLRISNISLIDDNKRSLMERKQDKKIQQNKNPYPNYNASRDMPLPANTLEIIDKQGRFHPSVKWETYQTFGSDSIKHLVDILTCNVAEETPITGMCFRPRLGILVWSAGEIVTSYSVCFECKQIKTSSNDARFSNNCEINQRLLKAEVSRLGY